jgi:hypothetical protein
LLLQFHPPPAHDLAFFFIYLFLGEPFLLHLPFPTKDLCVPIPAKDALPSVSLLLHALAVMLIPHPSQTPTFAPFPSL